MDREFQLVRAIASSRGLQQLVFHLFHTGYSAKWDDHIQSTVDDIMETYDCITVAGPTPRSLVIFPRETRRKKPACIVIHSETSTLTDFASVLNVGLYKVEVVEAGKYEVARPSTQPVTESETEG